MWYSATLYSLCKCINSHLFFAKLPGSSAVRKAAKRHTAHDKNAREFSIRRATPGWWMNCHVKQKTDIFLSCTSWNAKPERWESGCNLNLHNWILLDYKERLVDWRWEKSDPVLLSCKLPFFEESRKTIMCKGRIGNERKVLTFCWCRQKYFAQQLGICAIIPCHPWESRH